MIDVLLATRIVYPRCQDVTRGISSYPYLFPGRRDAQGLDPGSGGVVNDAISFVDIAEPFALAHSAVTRRPIIEIGQAGRFGQFDHFRRCHGELNTRDLPP